MESALSLDTTFLIDLQKERHRNKRGSAFRLLESHPQAVLWCSAVAWGEFLEGLSSGAEHPLAMAVRAHIHVYPVTEHTAEIYASHTRALRAIGKLPGANDLWIAAAAIERDEPLVTRNAKDFKSMPELRVISY